LAGLSLRPDWPCVRVRTGICPLTSELPGGRNEVAHASASMLLARSSSPARAAGLTTEQQSRLARHRTSGRFGAGRSPASGSEADVEKLERTAIASIETSRPRRRSGVGRGSPAGGEPGRWQAHPAGPTPRSTATAGEQTAALDGRLDHNNPPAGQSTILLWDSDVQLRWLAGCSWTVGGQRHLYTRRLQ